MAKAKKHSAKSVAKKIHRGKKKGHGKKKKSHAKKK